MCPVSTTFLCLQWTLSSLPLPFSLSHFLRVHSSSHATSQPKISRRVISIFSKANPSATELQRAILVGCFCLVFWFFGFLVAQPAEWGIQKRAHMTTLQVVCKCNGASGNVTLAFSLAAIVTHQRHVASRQPCSNTASINYTHKHTHTHIIITSISNLKIQSNEIF